MVSRRFDLDDKDVMISVDPNITVGSRVQVVQATDENGKKTLTVKLDKK